MAEHHRQCQAGYVAANDEETNEVDVDLTSLLPQEEITLIFFIFTIYSL